MINLFQAWLTSLQSLWENKRVTAFAAFIDLLFFYGFGKAYASIFLSTAGHLKKLNEVITVTANDITTSSVTGSLLTQPEFVASYTAVLKSFVFILLLLIVFWIFFQGSNWFLAEYISTKKTCDLILKK